MANKWDECSVWLCVGRATDGAERPRAILTGEYSESGLTFTVRRQYSGDVVGRARGFGYDRQGSALADGLAQVFGIPAIDGAVGESSVIDHARVCGVRVYRLGEALYALAGE